jgi:putative ABC transport system permease protein
MVWREVERRPLRLALSSLGIAMAVAILVTGRFFHDSINYLMDVHFEASMREDVSVTFSQPVPGRSIRALDEVPGVLHAEGIRMLPVRYVAGPRERNSLIMGYPAGGRLRALVDKDAETIEPPREGILLSRKLAEILAVEAGQDVRLEVLEGQRPTLEVHVVGLVDDMLGLQGHMQLSALADLLKEQPRYSMGLLSVDPERQQQTYDRLREMPNVVEIVRRDSIFENFRNQSGEMVLVFTMVLAIFAAVIAVGVVYNNARVSLSMRSRDLASLRVLGFTRREISAILLGELAIQVLVALPLGLAIGTWLSGLVAATVDPESYRIPVIISSRTYAFAAVVTLGASLVSALMVRRKLDRLDLIAVLKTRE